MLIWTTMAKDVLREASAKADLMEHREVEPLHLLWAATGRTGLEALRLGKNDYQQARLHFQLERDLNELPVMATKNSKAWGQCATPSPKLQQLLLRAADYSTRGKPPESRGRISLSVLMEALLRDDHRTASVLRTRNEMQLSTV